MYKHRLVKETVCTVLIISFLYLSLFSGVALSSSTEKLSDYLVETLSTMRNNDEIEVTVFFKDIDDSGLRKKVIDKCGKDIDVYENETRFYNEVVPNIKVNDKTIRSMVSMSEITTANFNLDNKKSTLDLELRKNINREITNEMNEYLTGRRAVRSDMVKEYLGEFKKLFDNDDVVFSSEYIEMMRVNLSKSEILSLSNNPYVESIYYSDKCGENEAWHIPELIDADPITGSGSANYNEGSGYDGTGITIGIIEHEGATYDSDNYSIADAATSGKLVFIPTPGVAEPVEDTHTTIITSVICGKNVTIDGKTYRGLAQGATVYQTAIHNSEEFYAAVETLLDEGVNIINFSAKLSLTSQVYYDEYDKAVDKYVMDNKIAFIKSAGNGDNVTSPGRAYNAIVVGNVQTESREGLLLSPSFSVEGSGYYEPSYLPNRPDVVAPGFNIRIPDSETSAEIIGSGTSFSTPVVTALAAQLMQSDIICLGNPNFVKNVIMCGASNNLIQNTGGIYGELMDKSGAGLVNAVDSLGAKDNSYFELILHGYNNTNYETIQNVYLKKGQTIKIVLSYLKEENINITEDYKNNLDLRLAQINGYAVNEVYAVSDSTNNNVEIVEYRATSSGTYNIQVRLLESILTADGNDDLHYCVTWRIF